MALLLLLLSLCLSVCTSHQQFQSQSQLSLSTWHGRFVPLYPRLRPDHVHSVAHHVCFPCHCCCCRFAFAAFRLALSLSFCLCEVCRTWPEWISAWASFIFANYLWLKIYKIHEWAKPKKEADKINVAVAVAVDVAVGFALNTKLSIIFNWKFSRELNFEPGFVSLSPSLLVFACQLQLVLAQLCKPLGQLVVCQLVLATVLRQTTLAPGLSSCTSSPSSGLTCPNMGPLNFSKMSYLISHLDVFIASASRAMLD